MSWRCRCSGAALLQFPRRYVGPVQQLVQEGQRVFRVLLRYGVEPVVARVRSIVTEQPHLVSPLAQLWVQAADGNQLLDLGDKLRWLCHPVDAHTLGGA